MLTMSNGFWTTAAGILARLAMFAESLEWGSFNEAIIKISTSQLRNVEFQMMGPTTGNICELCDENVGKVFRLGEFMIDLPAHPNCRHWWDIPQQPTIGEFT